MAMIQINEAYSEIRRLLPGINRTLAPDQLAQAAERLGARVQWVRIEQTLELSDDQILDELLKLPTTPLRGEAIVFPHHLTNAGKAMRLNIHELRSYIGSFQTPVFDHDFILLALESPSLLLFQDETLFGMGSFIRIVNK